jgi:uncharacterized protein (TIGR00369 family)
LLHGGVSVVLAETLGSVAAGHVAAEGHMVVGLDINANHLKSARSGWVTGIARPVHIGRSTQVWHIDMHNDDGELTSLAVEVKQVALGVQSLQRCRQLLRGQLSWINGAHGFGVERFRLLPGPPLTNS